ncbi:AMP-dependent synthetase/ligase [Pseudonocardia sp. 73-21]|jgi:long-chain acyl-CoA synthetase|uniref:AMP-dependent synthetase/ligase n=1 Tax=Pseudonocardia sp. 73-21 TaxID=1895809 RepID=UPI000960E3D9|nr:AMP-dependent synthetase/ligase [Pseudonocardia sp. 73-21]OJY47689.1 MAG: long-chain fatty acid--CoA ligase [Pseudonocardia sp. 73-21]
MTTDIGLPQTVAALPAVAARRYGDRPAQRHLAGGVWQDVSYAELREISTEIGLGLVALGVAPGDRVCVLADTRAEWVQVEFGIALAGAVTVPIYPSSSADECEWVLGDSGAVVVVCENAALQAKVESVRDRLPALREVVLIDGEENTLAELRARAGDRDDLERRATAVVPDEPALIIYTSGTTGRPKGCVLTHRNLTECCRVCDAMGVMDASDVVYLFLPLAHVFAQVISLGSAGMGAVVAYCSDGAAAIMPDLAALSPTLLPSVPRIFEKVYATVSGLVPAEMRAKAVAAGMAVRQLERAGQPVPDELAAGYAQADAALFTKVRAVFGGAIRQAISGAAPIAPEIIEFFHAAGVPVNEGYGLSESTAMGTLNTLDAVRIGSIGRAVPDCDVRIAEDGEILMRGPHIFAGYWQNPGATAETLVDGWLQTGDLGTIDDDGYVTITGRKKDIIITAGGKNLSPGNVENDLRLSPWISQAVMHGDRRPYPVALITLDAEAVGPWAQGEGLPADIPTLAAHPAVRALVQQVVDEVNAHYATVAQIKRFAILDHDLSIETGELTPTLKVKRRVVEQQYAGLLDGLYD